MSLMSDGGGIYTLSSQPGTIIQKNFIENLIQSKWSWGSNHVYGIYLDKGSDYITVKDNLITNTTENVIINSKRNNTIWLNGLINLNEFKSINNLYNRMDSLVIWINTDQTCYRENYSDIILIPNPVKDEFFIKLSKGIYPEYLNFELFSRNGILVKKGVADQKSNTIYSGKLEDIKTGLYFLKLYIKNTEISLRVFYNPDLN